MMRKPAAVTINFARTDFRMLLLVRRWLVVLATASAVVLVMLALSARSYRAQGDEAEKQVKDLISAEGKLRPLMEERQQLVDNLNTMTGLLQSRRFSWTRFLTRLEEVFPEGIALTKLDFRPRELACTLDGFAQSPEALSRLMIGLQQSRSFKNPLLKKQSMEKGILSFNVTVLYSETPTSGPAPGTAGKPVR